MMDFSTRLLLMTVENLVNQKELWSEFDDLESGSVGKVGFGFLELEYGLVCAVYLT